MDKSQSLFLAAIILSGQKPNPPGVLRSSLYPVPYREDLIEGTVNLKVWELYQNLENTIGSTHIALTLKDTKVTISGGYENSVGYSSLGLIKEVQGGPIPITINYEEATGSTNLNLTKRVVKISYSNQIDTSVGTTNVTLTKG